jgi:PAS domain-containing protein
LVIARISKMLRLRAGVLGVYELYTGRPLLRFQHGLEPRWDAAMLDFGVEMPDFWGGVERVMEFPWGEPTIHSVVQPDFDRSRNRFARDWCDPQGIADFVAIKVANDAANFSSLVFTSDRLLEADTAGELDLLRTLSPHVRRAVLIGGLLDHGSVREDRLNATLNALPNGVMMIGAAGQILYTNAAATALLR